MKTERRSQAVLVAIGAVVIGLTTVAVLLAIRPPAELDPTTPEGTAQQYFRAVLEGDAELARTHLTPDLAGDCHTDDLHHRAPDAARVVVAHTEIIGDRAEVDVQITETEGQGPFDAGSYRFTETLFMEHAGDRWLIARPAWPLEFACR